MASSEPTIRGAAVPPLSDVVLARQPIVDRDRAVIGFELLYCPISETAEPAPPERATATVLAAALGEIGLDALVGRSLAFVKVTAPFLQEVRPLPMPAGQVVLDLDVARHGAVDEPLVSVLRELVDDGFTLALSGVADRPELEPLFELARFAKLDVQALAPPALAEAAERLRGRGLTLVAANVATNEHFEACRELPFDAFQGYFFPLPDLIRRDRTPTFDLDKLSRLVGSDDNFDALEQLIVCDVGLSHKLLRLVNSAHVGSRTPIESIRHALTLLGARTVSRWVLLLVLADGRSEFDELLLAALIRARMCELIAARDEEAEADRAFTVGLFSIADALLGEPLPELVEALPFDDRLVRALLDHDGPEGRILSATLAYERGYFDVAAQLDPNLRALARSYYAALEWAYEVTIQMR
jgi:EAL and modified HD-GYP domain-containing signal transduction protein